MNKPFLRELQDQLALIKEKLAGITIERGPLARPLPPAVKERRDKLIARKREIEQEIINYKP